MTAPPVKLKCVLTIDDKRKVLVGLKSDALVAAMAQKKKNDVLHVHVLWMPSYPDDFYPDPLNGHFAQRHPDNQRYTVLVKMKDSEYSTCIFE